MRLVNVFRGLAYFAHTMSWGLGITVLVLSLIMFSLHSEALHIPQFQVRFMIVVMETFGIFVFTTGFIGCLAQVRVHRNTLKLHIAVSSTVSLIGAAMAVYIPTAPGGFRFVEESDWSALGNDTIDSFQAKYKCCGFNGPSDFTLNPMRLSCFEKSSLDGSILVLTSFDRGCALELDNVFLVVWVMCSVLVAGGLPVLLMGLIGSAGLENHLRRQKQGEQERFAAAQNAMRKAAEKRGKVATKRPIRNGMTPVESTK